jgi:MarR family transcriptional regulator for hemolysin
MTSLAPAHPGGTVVCTSPDLSFLLDHTSHVLRTKMAAALAEVGMTARMHCVLVKAVEEERTQIQIAEIGDIDKTTMVVTVDALEKAGLAERRPSATDRRARIIAVTEAGAEMAARTQAIVDRVHAEAIGSLPEAMRPVLLEALKLLAQDQLASPEESPAAARRARQS